MKRIPEVQIGTPATDRPAVREFTSLAPWAPPPANLARRAVLEERPARVVQAADALERLKRWLDRNQDGEILDDLERAGRWALWLLRLAARFFPGVRPVADAAGQVEDALEDALEDAPPPAGVRK